MTSGIYQISHAPSGRTYIGSATNLSRRKAFHRHHLRRGTHHSSKLQRAWAKYGESAFDFKTLLVCAPRHLVFYEQRVIDAFDAVLQGFNCAPMAGNSLGYRHTPESLAKMSRASMGRKNQYARGAVMSASTKAKISAANRGRNPTPETLAKLRAARRGKRPSLGMRHSPEARMKMSLARNGVSNAASGAARLGKKRGPYNKTRREP